MVFTVVVVKKTCLKQHIVDDHIAPLSDSCGLDQQPLFNWENDTFDDGMELILHRSPLGDGIH